MRKKSRKFHRKIISPGIHGMIRSDICHEDLQKYRGLTELMII